VRVASASHTPKLRTDRERNQGRPPTSFFGLRRRRFGSATAPPVIVGISRSCRSGVPARTMRQLTFLRLAARTRPPTQTHTPCCVRAASFGCATRFPRAAGERVVFVDQRLPRLPFGADGAGGFLPRVPLGCLGMADHLGVPPTGLRCSMSGAVVRGIGRLARWRPRLGDSATQLLAVTERPHT